MVPPQRIGPVASGLNPLIVRSLETGKVEAAIDLLLAAAGLRETFTEVGELATAPAAVNLVRGPDGPALVCCEPLTPTRNFTYARLAQHLRGERDVLTCPLPGFAPDEHVPAGLDALMAAQTARVLDSGVEKNFVLLGHSSGGWVAHALASHLEQRGVRPRAVLLIDTPTTAELRRTSLVPVLRALYDLWGEFLVLDDVQLTALGWYLKLFQDWVPRPLKTPVHFIGAEDSLPYTDGDRWENQWQTATSAQIPGNHFTIMTEQVAALAAAIRQECGRLP